MPDEPENLVLVQLREVRTKLRDLDEIKTRLDGLNTRFDEMRGYVVHALGLGSMNDMKAGELDARMAAGEAYRRRVDERFEGIERRLTRVEERIDD